LLSNPSIKRIFVGISWFSKIIFHRLNIRFLFHCFIKMIKIFGPLILFCSCNCAHREFLLNMDRTHPTCRLLKCIHNGHYFWDSFLSFLFLLLQFFLFSFFFLIFFWWFRNKRTECSLSIYIFYLINSLYGLFFIVLLNFFVVWMNASSKLNFWCIC